MHTPHLSAALAKAASIEDCSVLVLWVGSGLVRAYFELSFNGGYITERYGDTDPLWFGSPPIGGDRALPLGGNGRMMEMACADLLEQVRLMESGRPRPEPQHHVVLPELSDPPRAALDAALAELANLDNPMFLEIRQHTDATVEARAFVLRGAARSVVRDERDQPIVGHSDAHDPLIAQEQALRQLGDGLAALTAAPADLQLQLFAL